jgi:hypothetical protein
MGKNKTHILCAAQFSTGPEVPDRLEMKWNETEPCISTATLGYIARYVIPCTELEAMYVYRNIKMRSRNLYCREKQ